MDAPRQQQQSDPRRRVDGAQACHVVKSGSNRKIGRVKATPTLKLKPIASQPLAPQGFTFVEPQRLRREAERAGPMADAIVTTLLNTAMRVDELIRLTWADVTLLPRSGKAAIRMGKGDKARTVLLNTPVRAALNGVRPPSADGAVFRGKPGPYTDCGIRHLLTLPGRRADVTPVRPHRFRHDTARRRTARIGVSLEPRVPVRSSRQVVSECPI